MHQAELLFFLIFSLTIYYTHKYYLYIYIYIYIIYIYIYIYELWDNRHNDIYAIKMRTLIENNKLNGDAYNAFRILQIKTSTFLWVQFSEEGHLC